MFEAGKPGKTFLLVEYIAAPSGYDPRMPFVEGAEVGRVKIRNGQEWTNMTAICNMVCPPSLKCVIGSKRKYMMKIC
ncbi:hypothetical protein WUBG_09729 [Wuchereria bancrofti]|uniref:Uncharacterized protein n=1 Tax=Wuchereria bancrofti TaxID=6293 RepID=J9EQL6_WUCBA|nr:hypothetical protein WUBG_09729 [Wuchereria bancrofti]